MTGYELSANALSSREGDNLHLRMFTETRRFAFTGGTGRLSLQSIFTGPEDVRATVVTSTGHRIDLEERSLVTVLVPLRGRLDVSVGDRELTAREGDLLLFPPNARRTRTIPPADGTFKALVITFPRMAAEQLSGSRRALDILKSIGNGIGFPDERGIARALAAVQAEQTELTRSGAVRARDQALRAVLLNETLETLFGLIPVLSESPRTPTAAWRKVLAAEDVMQACYDQPLAMTEVASALGVSLRSLQAAFLEARGVGPREVLNRIRLDHAHHRLRLAPPDVQVTEVALDCGFTHLGRFSQCYRKAYGEAPSETVRRRMGRAVAAR